MKLFTKFTMHFHKDQKGFHELKTLPVYFDATWNRTKNFEIRKMDRLFEVGDVVLLREWEDEIYTGRQIWAEIAYIYIGDGLYGLPKGWVILQLI